MDKQISIDHFIELFIVIKQIKHYGNSNNETAFYAPWTFNINLLQEFILHSKSDYRYSELLSCFDFTMVRGVPFCLEYHISLNRARSKFLISGIFDDEVHITKNYSNARIIGENESLYSLMDSFVTDFDFFTQDKMSYLKGNAMFDNNTNQDLANNIRNIFELQRRMNHKFTDEVED